MIFVSDRHSPWLGVCNGKTGARLVILNGPGEIGEILEAVEGWLTGYPFRVVESGMGVISENEEVVYTWMTECYLMRWIWAGGRYIIECGKYAVLGLGGRSMQIIFEPERGKVVLRDGEHSYTLVVGREE